MGFALDGVLALGGVFFALHGVSCMGLIFFDGWRSLHGLEFRQLWRLHSLDAAF